MYNQYMYHAYIHIYIYIYMYNLYMYLNAERVTASCHSLTKEAVGPQHCTNYPCICVCHDSFICVA